MSGIDIFLKLLPFTYSENSSVQFFFGLRLGDWIITIIICLLWLLFGYGYFKLRKSKKQDEKKINFLLQTLQEYKDKMQTHYEEFLDKLESFDNKGKDNEVYKLWNEFNESLVKTENTFTGHTDYYKSIDAEHFFHKKNLLTHIGTKLYSTIPSLLLGIGLIGTFLGLFVGLVQMNFSTQVLLEASMKELIHAAGVKFASSIWGLGLSLVFTYIDKKFENELENKIDEIQELVNFAFTRRTAEQSLEDINISAKLQTEALNDLRITLADIIPQTQAISDKFIGERLDRLSNALENFTQKTSESNSQALENVLEKFISKLQDAGSHQGKELANILENTTEKFSVLVNTLENSAKIQDERNEQLRNDIEEIKTSQIDVLEKMSDNIGKSAKDAADTLSDASNKIASSQQDIVNKLIDASNVLNNSPKLLEQSFVNINNQVKQVEHAINNMIIAMQNVPTHLQSFETSSNKLVGFGEKIEKVSNSLSNFSSSLDEQKQSLDKISFELDATVDKSKQIGQNSEATYTTLAKQYDELLSVNSRTMEEFARTVKNYLDEYHRNTQAGINTTFGTFDAQLSKFADTLKNAINELNDAITEIAENRVQG